LWASGSYFPWTDLSDEIKLHILSFVPPKDRLRISPTNQKFNALVHDRTFEYENTVARLSLLLKDIFTRRGQTPQEIQISVQEIIACYFSDPEDIRNLMEEIPRGGNETPSQALLRFITQALDDPYFGLEKIIKEKTISSWGNGLSWEEKNLKLIPPCLFQLPFKKIFLSCNELLFLPRPLEN